VNLLEEAFQEKWYHAKILHRGLAVVTQKKTVIFTNALYPARNGRNLSLLNSTPTLNS